MTVSLRAGSRRGRKYQILRLPRLALLALAILTAVIVAAVFAPWIAPASPIAGNLGARLLPPFAEFDGVRYFLGTDKLGRDILSRLIYAAQTSMKLAAAAIAIGGTIGCTLGFVAAYYRGWRESLIMGMADTVMGFPVILLALALAVVYGPSLRVVVGILVFILWARFARLVRGEALAIMARDYVLLAQTAGCTVRRIIWRHLLPNVASSIVVMATLQVGYVVMIEASLSFLGAGIPPPSPSWGGMVADGRDNLSTSWWISTLPGIVIAFVILSFNLVGDWLVDVLDPRHVELL